MTDLRTILAVLTLILVAACGRAPSSDVDISAARITEPITGRTVSLGGFEVKAIGEDMRLLSVSSEAASRIELHTMLNEDGVLKMRRLPDGLTVAAGETATLGSGGPHLMVFGLRDDLVAGDEITLQITYEQAGQTRTRSVGSVIQSLGAETGQTNH